MRLAHTARLAHGYWPMANTQCGSIWFRRCTQRRNKKKRPKGRLLKYYNELGLELSTNLSTDAHNFCTKLTFDIKCEEITFEFHTDETS